MASHEDEVLMDVETAKAIFTRMYQALEMLRLVDENKDNTSLTVADLYKKFLKQSPENPSDHVFSNHQFFMGCLLAFIALPQGTVDGIDNTPVAKLDESWHLSNATITKHSDSENITLQTFVRKLRNSISHARFCATNENGELGFVFEDRSKDTINFRAQLSGKDLLDFCKRFNRWVITGA